MVIFLGSIRSAKVDGARDAIVAIASVDPRFGAAEIRCLDLGDAGPRMPMTEGAILRGAHHRSAAIVERQWAERPADSVWYAVGLEGGLDPLRLPDGGTAHALKTWACVTDGRRWSYGAGGAVVVPAPIAAMVVEGAELGAVVDSLAGAPVRGTRGAWGLLTRDLMTRRDAFRVSVLSAFAPFYNPEPYAAA